MSGSPSLLGTTLETPGLWDAFAVHQRPCTVGDPWVGGGGELLGTLWWVSPLARAPQVCSGGSKPLPESRSQQPAPARLASLCCRGMLQCLPPQQSVTMETPGTPHWMQGGGMPGKGKGRRGSGWPGMEALEAGPAPGPLGRLGPSGKGVSGASAPICGPVAHYSGPAGSCGSQLLLTCPGNCPQQDSS